MNYATNTLGRVMALAKPTIVAMLCLSGVAAVAAESRPNILLIVIDDLGWNDIGYHNSAIRSPHLDRLAGEGARLDCHYVMPQCTPTRVALMTGRYPSRFGLHCAQASNDQAFPHGTLTMASLLKSQGYATGMSGKWHLGSKPQWGPQHYGFDYSHGSLTGAVGMYDHRYRLNSPFTTTWHRNGEWIEQQGHVTDLTAGEAVEWIHGHSGDDSPWFFYVPFHAVHTPLVERDPHWQAMNNHIEDEDRRLYAAAVSHMDHAVGQMLAALDESGQREQTLVIVTSDNGAQVNHGGGAYPPPDPKLAKFSSNLPLRGKKTETFEGGYRVPACASWPGTLPQGKVTAPLHAVDWMPTIAHLAGYEIEEDPSWDGQNIWPLLTNGDEPPSPRTIYIVWGQKRQREALRHGDWKIVRNGGKEWMLFNLADDPYEKQNLAADEPQQMQRLLAIYRTERSRDADSQ